MLLFLFDKEDGGGGGDGIVKGLRTSTILFGVIF
jgi:hypothetical protein